MSYIARMITASRTDLSDFPGLPQDAQMHRAHGNLQFTAQLERDYARAHLLDNATLIRLTCVIATLVALTRGLEQLVGNLPSGIALFDLVLVITGSALLAAIAFSPMFERMYLPWAQIIVPVRNVIIAAHVVYVAALGDAEVLMILPLMLVGPFFFLGFKFRIGLMCGGLMVITFAASAFIFGLPLPIALRAGAFLLIAFIACGIAARHVEKWSRRSFLETRAIVELAHQDSLTGTANRRVFDQQLSGLWTQAIEEGRRITILLLDVDHFKAYNDRYGHQAGDEALRQIAGAIKASVARPLDVLARYGGEEFAAVLYDMDGRQARAVAELMRRAVLRLGIEHRGSGPLGRVTISVGVAAVKPDRERGPQGALQLADQSLYDAKAKGRNRVEVMDDTHYDLLITGVFTVNPRAPAMSESNRVTEA